MQILIHFYEIRTTKLMKTIYVYIELSLLADFFKKWVYKIDKPKIESMKRIH